MTSITPRSSAATAAGMPVGLALLALVAFAIPAVAEELPVRKAGLWQIRTVADSMGMKTFETCIGPGDAIVSGIGDKGCASPQVKRISGEVFVDVACTGQAGKQMTSTLLTGDYATWYRAVSKMTFNPPRDGLAHVGVIVDGKYLSANCADASKKAPSSAAITH